MMSCESSTATEEVGPLLEPPPQLSSSAPKIKRMTGATINDLIRHDIEAKR